MSAEEPAVGAGRSNSVLDVPNVSLYLLGADVDAVLDRLNDDSEVAFLVRDDGQRWRATETLSDPAVATVLWHVPSGPPITLSPDGPTGTVDDPWSGWVDHDWEDPVDNLIPRLQDSPNLFELNLDVPQRSDVPIGLSSLSWIGDHYAAIGRSASDSARRWWNRTRSFVQRSATPVSRSGDLHRLHRNRRLHVWAFPEALSALEAGRHRRDNPRDRWSRE